MNPRLLIPGSIVNTFWHLPKAILANIAYQFPGKNLTVIGVTGSNGKTTTVTGIYHLLDYAKIKTGMISTVMAKIGKQEIDTGFHVTSPEPWPLQKIINQMKSRMLTHLVLEATSHGLDQHRLFGIKFTVGIVTNITHEHIDYHKTYTNYLQAKAKLLKNVKIAILNRDDQSYHPLLKYIQKYNPAVQIISYGIQTKDKKPKFQYDSNLALTAFNIHHFSSGTKFTCLINKNKAQQKLAITIPLIGNYNVSNSLAVIAAGITLDINPHTIQKSLETFPSISGRMELTHWKGRNIVIDFAHTPNALQSALETLRQNSKLETRNSKLISVFGCAGLRDHQKRPMMGKISAQLADITILTAEDPRTEDVNHIIAQIAAGCQAAGAEEHLGGVIPLKKSIESHLRGERRTKSVFIRIPDRQQAITTSIAISKPHDTIGIFGKGHEQSMCYGTTEHPWSDRKAVQKAIQSHQY
jgi:UDP-N-acetylmuramoyl-L-alanyl-D-glutamate--2,6-diaminopimelate ligase